MEKFNINSRFTKKLISNKNINLITNLTATNMVIDQESEMINEILFQSNKKEIKVKSKFFILCCGAIEMQKLYLIIV